MLDGRDTGEDPRQPALDESAERPRRERPAAHDPLEHLHRVRRQEPEEAGDHQVRPYSGPEPPSGGVRRPPFAVIAPHWTQFDGETRTSTFPSCSWPSS